MTAVARRRRGRGLRRSAPGRDGHMLGAETHPAIAAALAAGPRGSADLSEYLPPRFDQGQTETCFAHSAAAGIVCALAAQGHALGFTPSPLLIASTTYADVRSATTLTDPLPPLADTGAEFQDVAAALGRWGVGTMGADVDGRHSDVPDDDAGVPFEEPDPSRLLAAGSHLVVGEYAITIDDTAPSLIAASLDACIPVWIGGLVGSSYEDADANSVQGPASLDDTTAGGHAQLVAGYRTTAGALEFLVINSWGTGWANDGTVWVTNEFIRELWTAWPLPVRS